MTKRVTTVRTDDGRVVCARCELATTFWTRFRGLMGRASLAPDETSWPSIGRATVWVSTPG